MHKHAHLKNVLCQLYDDETVYQKITLICIFYESTTCVSELVIGHVYFSNRILGKN